MRDDQMTEMRSDVKNIFFLLYKKHVKNVQIHKFQISAGHQIACTVLLQYKIEPSMMS